MYKHILLILETNEVNEKGNVLTALSVSTLK